MGKSCKEAAQSLFECMKSTDCVKNGGDIKECMKSNAELCSQYRNSYFACKRGGLDMRSRIRGVRVY